MKKIILSIILFSLIYFVSSILSYNALILKNFEYLPITDLTRNNIQRARIYSKYLDNISIYDIQKHFNIADNINVLDSKPYELNVSEYDPIFEIYRVRNYIFLSIIENQTIASVESISNKCYYLWLFHWVKIKCESTGQA